MPGDRLTLPQRRAIEAGLTVGRGYAEIARLLGRPTSTISREVRRNGGHNHYRAEHAHELAGRRARRVGTRPGSSPTADRNSAAPDDAGGASGTRRRDVEAGLVEMMNAAGFPRMMASVLVALLLSDAGTLTAADLVRDLRVSPASISKAVRSLEHLRFLRREGTPGRRGQRYVLDGDMWMGLWSARTETMATWGAEIGDAAELLGVSTPPGARLAHMSRFLVFLHEEMERATDRWRVLSAET